MDNSKKTPPAVKTAIVILGASGDLAKRKLVPALAECCGKQAIDDSTIIVGEGRTPFTDESFREHVGLTPAFSKRLFYHQGMTGLKNFLDSKGSFGRIIVFMALPPSSYAQAAAELVGDGFGATTSLIIEKPFGYNASSARELNTSLHRYFSEQQIYRIDHYLAKDAVQNILVFRFANTLFEPVWNNAFIESIQINAFEDIGVENRGAYFDKAGIIRDMVQNHLCQLLCFITMEQPQSMDAEGVRRQKLAVLSCIRAMDCRRFQYKGYHGEPGVAPGSTTETYAEIKLVIDNDRFRGVPVFIRTGKALNRKGTDIGIVFRPVEKQLFGSNAQASRNRIIFGIQPAAGITVDLSSKVPGHGMTIGSTKLRFCYSDSFRSQTPEAYRKLLLDAIAGDRTLFVSAEETELSWNIFGPVLDKGEVLPYDRGTVPPLCFAKSWIDFSAYADACLPDQDSLDKKTGLL